MTGFRQFNLPIMGRISTGLFLAALLLTVRLMGQSGTISGNPDYTITKKFLSTENGLASHEVFCGLQDSSGFVWFGTRNGLNRYDGKNFLLFTRQRNGLQENKVVQVAKDDADNLFIEYGSSGFQLMTNGKVDVMNATTRQIRTLTAAFPNLPFKERDVYWISNDGSGEVNFLTASPFRLWKYSRKNGFSLRFEMKAWDQSDQQVDYRTTGPYCVFMGGKVLLKRTNRDVQYLVEKKNASAFRQNAVLRSLPMGLTDDKELIITYNKTGNVDRFEVDRLTKAGQLLPVSEPARYSVELIKGRYWFQVCASVTGGASMFFIPTEALYLWNKDALLRVVGPNEMKGFENLFIYQLFPDSLGNLWACTSHGVIQLTIKKNRFTSYFTSSQQRIQPNGQARGIYADNTGKIVANIWTTTFSQKNGVMQAVGNDFIHYALVRHNSKLYSGGYTVYRFDEHRNRMIVYPEGVQSEIWSMFSLNDSLLLLGRTTGFWLFNSNSARFDSIRTIPRGSDARFIYRFLRDKTGKVYAVAENGLYRLQTSGSPRSWLMSKVKSAFLDGLSLFDAYRDPDGTFWLATNGEGLFHWNPKTGVSRQFNITAGLPSDVLYRIEPDDAGNLWISSDYGLTRFGCKTFSVSTYTTIDGISHNEFNRTSSFKASDGRLFFGGVNGVIGFNPGDFSADTTGLQVPFRVISFNQFVGSENELVDKTTALQGGEGIVLRPEDKFFTLDFQLLDFTKEEGHRYAYKIEGVDKSWNYIHENSVRISGLPYGSFILHVKAQNSEGTWNRRELSIPLKVLKPVYLQWWFVAAVLASLAVAVYVIIRLRVRQLAREKRRLEETIADRTLQLKKSLSEQSALLLEKDVLMKEIHHRVKNNLQVISGLLELQSKALKDEAAREALQEGRNRVRSIALIHQNLYQFENLSSIDLKRFVNDLCRQVESVFQIQKKVSLVINVPALDLDIDSAVPLGLILNELLSNSFKYAFANVPEGKIALTIHETGQGHYRLEYSDNGPGLPSDFEMGRATTLGLQLVSDLSRQIGGRVRYNSINGASFSINFTNREVRKNED